MNRALELKALVRGPKTVFDEIKHCATAAIEPEVWLSRELTLS